jgi:hypothetical protein
VDAQRAHLQSLRVPVHEMVHTKIETKAEIVLTGAGGLTVGDWVEVLHDFSQGTTGTSTAQGTTLEEGVASL